MCDYLKYPFDQNKSEIKFVEKNYFILNIYFLKLKFNFNITSIPHAKTLLNNPILYEWSIRYET